LTKVNGIYCLKKSEIIRGYNSFKDILANSKLITNSFLRVYIQVNRDYKGTGESKIFKDPLANVKVGFVVSKRIVRKASQRNRLKRLSREAYRLNKNLLSIHPEKEIFLLFGFNESFKENLNNLEIEIVKANMRMLLQKILDYLNKQN
jgi:ribonuclease P protein component